GPSWRYVEEGVRVFGHPFTLARRPEFRTYFLESHPTSAFLVKISCNRSFGGITSPVEVAAEAPAPLIWDRSVQNKDIINYEFVCLSSLEQCEEACGERWAHSQSG